MGWMHRLDSIRNLSHRRTAAEINRRFAACIDFGRYGQMPPQPAEETTKMAEVECFAKKYGGFYIKVSMVVKWPGCCSWRYDGSEAAVGAM